jgi:glycosyltransferase involved in cell wall biosynthesis
MKISYAITVCNEREEIERLVSYLLEHKRDEDEIIVQMDLDPSKGTPGQSYGLEDENKKSVLGYIMQQQERGHIKVILAPLRNDFAQFKNKLNSNCSGDYIFQIDADEIPNPDLFTLLPMIVADNVDLIWVPRINTVTGLTEAHIKKWGWRVNEEGWVNWPDMQSRIYRNDPSINWEGRVHERVVGFKTYATLPPQPNWALRHPKTIDRQERQNDFYEGI